MRARAGLTPSDELNSHEVNQTERDYSIERVSELAITKAACLRSRCHIRSSQRIGKDSLGSGRRLKDLRLVSSSLKIVHALRVKENRREFVVR